MCCLKGNPNMEENTTPIPDEIQRWKKIANAVYNGALDQYCGRENMFATTANLLDYLYKYTTTQQQPITNSLNGDGGYFYPKHLNGSLKLKTFMLLLIRQEQSITYRCQLCHNLVIKHTENNEGEHSGQFLCETNTARVVDFSTALQCLQHLAIFHTPLFIMLFIELVRKKQHDLHIDQKARRDIAQYIFDRLGDVSKKLTTYEQTDVFMMLWWRYQNRRSCRLFDVTIPWYITCSTMSGKWNPNNDSLILREPNLIYKFICHSKVYQLYESDHVYVKPATPKIIACNAGSCWCTYSVCVTIPKQQSEAYLRTISLAYEKRCEQQNNRLFSVSQLKTTDVVYPKLDCIALEETDDSHNITLHLVVTLDAKWIPLHSWVARITQNTHVLHKQRVVMGVLGAIHEMCAANKRPPRELYRKSDENVIENITKYVLYNMFFVHVDTFDTLSLLPYCTIDRLYRSSNTPEDEMDFKQACCNAIINVFTYEIDNQFSHQQYIKDIWNMIDVANDCLGSTWIGFEKHFCPQPRIETTIEAGVPYLSDYSEDKFNAELIKMECVTPFHVTLIAPNAELLQTNNKDECVTTETKHKLTLLAKAVTSQRVVSNELIAMQHDRRRKRIAEASVAELHFDDGQQQTTSEQRINETDASNTPSKQTIDDADFVFNTDSYMFSVTPTLEGLFDNPVLYDDSTLQSRNHPDDEQTDGVFGHFFNTLVEPDEGRLTTNDEPITSYPVTDILSQAIRNELNNRHTEDISTDEDLCELLAFDNPQTDTQNNALRVNNWINVAYNDNNTTPNAEPQSIPEIINNSRRRKKKKITPQETVTVAQLITRNARWRSNGIQPEDCMCASDYIPYKPLTCDTPIRNEHLFMDLNIKPNQMYIVFR